jgi:hypothetical protein
MARKGFHYDRTAVAHALIDLSKTAYSQEKENHADISTHRSDHHNEITDKQIEFIKSLFVFKL